MKGETPLLHVFPYSGFHFSEKEARPSKDSSAADRLARMEEKYEKEGIRISVEGVLVVEKENWPHLILMQSKDTENTYYKLPGGRLRPGEDEIEGLKRKLTSKLTLPGDKPDWQIGDFMGMWWKPDFDGEFSSYLDSHTTELKECKMVFIVHLSEGMNFAVPENFKLLPVHFADLWGKREIFGRVISSIPAQLSRFELEYHGL